MTTDTRRDIAAEAGPSPGRPARARRSLLLSQRATRARRLASLAGQAVLLLITSASVFAVLFIFYYIARDAIPFFQLRGFREFFTGREWATAIIYEEPSFGALPIFYGSAMVTVGAILVAVPLGVSAAVCLSDVLPFAVRQMVKPVIEVLAAIPSVAYGFFALVILAPLLQEQGGRLMALGVWLAGAPLAGLAVLVLGDLLTARVAGGARRIVQLAVSVGLAVLAFAGLRELAGVLRDVDVASGRNALNVSLILGVMALPTVVSVAEDALQAVGRELREGSYALGATRAETVLRVVIPAASSGIAAAVILGVMRAFGETMVVWMAAGGATEVPSPWYDYTASIRTLTATIAGEMGEAEQMTGAARYHALFAMALCLLAISFVLNLVSEWAVRRTRKKMRGG
ncbi:MAG: PstC family ABC transporter permease [Candidatus Brocadiia bacterium]